jgi:uncharacterized repeat protein (TIGR03803 family)
MAMRSRAALAALALTALIPGHSSAAGTTSFTALHQFDSDTDGKFPEGALLQDGAGNLYGTTTSGGGGDGTIYKIDSAGKEKVLFAFSDFVTGTFPASALIHDEAENLYGIADGGPGGAGVIFKLSPDGEQTLLHSFQGGFNLKPKVPTGGILMDNSGNIFGTTLSGGNALGQFGCNQFGCGTVFRLDTAGTLHVLHKFIGSDGTQPFGPLVQDPERNLYGVSESGGDPSCPDPRSGNIGCGTVFKLSKDRVITVLHTFQGGPDGSSPQPGLLLDATGNLYGTTFQGGRSEHGIVFKISKKGKYTIVHRFSQNEGKNPNGGLVSDPAGNLYGTAQLGGRHDLGSVFQLTPDGGLNVLHSFRGLKDGASPLAGLIRDEAGHLFGTTVRNFLVQPIQGGNVFEITP